MIKRALMAAAIAGGASHAYSQDDTEPTWAMAIELGAISTSGNTETLSVQSKADIRQDLEKWQNEYMASVLFKQDEVEQDGVTNTATTAEKYFLSAKTAYKLNREHSNLFLFGSHTDDKFGAFRKYTTISAGYGTRWINRDNLYWDVEIGPGYFRGTRFLEDDSEISETGFMVRGATELQWELTETTTFAQTLSVESASDNTRTISDTSLSLKISDTLQMKIGYSLFHNTEVAPDKEAVDTTTFINLVYSR